MENRRTRSSILGGLLLILLGLVFLSFQLFPDLWGGFRIEMSWPLIVVGVGLFLLVFGLAIGEAGMAIPACIVAGIGGILYWQNMTGRFETWAYAWTLIPGFVGVGTILSGILGGTKLRESLEGGLGMILTSAVMFAIFGTFLGGLNLFGEYWPVLLILLGLILLIRSFLRRRPD